MAKMNQFSGPEMPKWFIRLRKPKRANPIDTA